MPTTPLHHKSLFKSPSLYLHGSLYLISCLPSRMAYIQQEKAFRFSRIRIFRTNITKASTQSPNLNNRIVVDLNVETFVGVLGDLGHMETSIWSREFLQVRHSYPMLPTPNPSFVLQFNIFKWALKWRFFEDLTCWTQSVDSSCDSKPVLSSLSRLFVVVFFYEKWHCTSSHSLKHFWLR